MRSLFRDVGLLAGWNYLEVFVLCRRSGKFQVNDQVNSSYDSDVVVHLDDDFALKDNATTECPEHDAQDKEAKALQGS